MSRIAIIYASTEGQTVKIATRIADVLAAAHVVTLQDVAALDGDLSLEDYDGVVIGGSIHAGEVQAELREFVRTHREQLETQTSAFFLVCLTAAFDKPDAKERIAGFVRDFVADTGWQPLHLGVFAGALKYSQYGWVKRQMMRYIAGQDSGDTDTSRDYEYTKWDSVDHFASDFGAAIDPQTMRSA